MIDPTSISRGTPSGAVDTRPPANAAEAADQFEEVLVRELVDAMTQSLFKQPLSGEDGPQWMASYADTQRDVLADVLTDHLLASGTLQFSDLMLQRWNRGSAEQSVSSPASTSDTSKP